MLAHVFVFYSSNDFSFSCPHLKSAPFFLAALGVYLDNHNSSSSTLSCFKSWLFSSVCDITVIWVLQFHAQWEPSWIKFPGSGLVWECSILDSLQPCSRWGIAWVKLLFPPSWRVWALTASPDGHWTISHILKVLTLYSLPRQFMSSLWGEKKNWKVSRAQEDTWSFGGGKNVLGNTNSSK